MKTYEVILTQRAKQDIQNAITWYDEQQPGVGRKFHSFLKTSIGIIQNSPHFEIRYGQIRCYKVKRFPYLIHFLLEADVIYILAVIHTHQDPKVHWPK